MEDKQQTSNHTSSEKLIQEEAELPRSRIYRFQYVTTALSQATTQEEIAKIMIDLGASTLHAIAGMVCLLDENKTLYLVAQAGYTPPQIIKIKKTLEGENTPLHDALRYKRPIFVHTNEEQVKLYPHMLDTFQEGVEESSVAIPLFVGNTSLGVVSYAFSKSHSFNPEDQEFMFALIQQCTQALDRARLYDEELGKKEELQKLIKRMSILQQTAVALSSAVTPEEMGAIIIEVGIKVLGAIGGEITVFSEDKKKVRIIAYRGYPEIFRKRFLEDWYEIPSDRPLLVVDAIRSRKVIAFTRYSDIRGEYVTAKKFAKLINIQSAIFIPVASEKNLEGVFSLYFRDSKTLKEEDVDFLKALAQAFAQAFDRGVLFEAEKKQQEYTAAVLKRMQSLQYITSLFSQAVTLDEVLERIVDEALRNLGADGGELALLSNDKKSYQIAAFKGYPKEYEDDFYKIWNEFPKEQPLLMSKVIESKEPIYIDNILSQKSKPKVVKEFLEMIEFRSVATSPLLLHKEAIGVLQLAFKKIKNFNEEEKTFLNALSLQAAQAIERSRIYEREREVSGQLRESESRFRALIENSSDGIVLLDANGKILYSSPSTKRITGYTAEESFGESIFKTTYPKDKAKMKKFIQEISESSEDTLLTLLYRRINRDGSIPWIEAIGRNMLHNPDIKAIVLNYRDITEQVEAENTIRQAKDELEVILENISESIMVWGSKGRILYANSAAISISQFNSKEELYDEGTVRNYLSRFESVFDEKGELVPEDDYPILQAMSEKKSVSRVLRLVFREDHTEQWRMIKAVPVLDLQGKLSLTIVVSHNISEEKHQEQIKDEFISTASHELKTPITSAKLYSGILSQKLQEMGDEKTYSMIIKLDQQLDRLTKLINDLLDVSKIKAGKIAFTKVNTSIEALMRDTVEEMQFTTVTHKLLFKGGSKKILFLDKERLREVFINLISNAIKYSPHADRVDISLEEIQDGVTVCICDHGVGIAKSEQEKIFEPFYRAEGGKFPGLGLGLHISSEIVKRQGGKMWVESIPGRGTKMYVSFPEKQKKV